MLYISSAECTKTKIGDFVFLTSFGMEKIHFDRDKLGQSRGLLKWPVCGSPEKARIAVSKLVPAPNEEVLTLHPHSLPLGYGIVGLDNAP